MLRIFQHAQVVLRIAHRHDLFSLKAEVLRQIRQRRPLSRVLRHNFDVARRRLGHLQMRQRRANGRARRPDIRVVRRAVVAVFRQIQLHNAALCRRVHRFFAVADFNQRALCDVIMLPRRKSDCRYSSILKAVHHDAIRHQKINRAFGVLRLK